MNNRRTRSMSTVLTFDNREIEDQGSVIWSTSHITDLETTRSSQMRKHGRRRLRMGSLALSALMTMHFRLPSSALTGGVFFFMIFLVAAVAALANPVRHFEIYLGQWSISGPGRAFRMIPMLDGIGIAMCINAIVRAITCCTIAAIALLYLVHSTADAALPFTYCRNFNLTTYAPETVNMQDLRYRVRPSIEKNDTEHESVTVGLIHKAWRNTTYFRRMIHKVKVCKETYAATYPPLYTTPAYNYFFVEVVQYREVENLSHLGPFNIPLAVAIIVTWLILWCFMLIERITYGRLVYTNIKQWFMYIPWIWSLLLIFQSASNMTWTQNLRRIFRVDTKDVIARMADAFEVALYIHSLSVGTELIHGKALHNYASGHIDPLLNDENLWHSGIVLMLAGLHTGGAAMCALVDRKHFNARQPYQMKESILWIMPMYSKCTSLGSHSHLMSSLVFGGLVFSYMTVAYFLLKTALHTIFEYRVKFIFVEQLVVACLILSCMALSLLYTTNGGIALLESVDALMTGVAMLFVVFMELASLLYVYGSRDFQSDLDLATEENTCASRIGIMLKLAPFITLFLIAKGKNGTLLKPANLFFVSLFAEWVLSRSNATQEFEFWLILDLDKIMLCMKSTVLPNAEMDSKYMMLATIPLIAVMLALPLRASRNAYTFLRHRGRN